MGELASLQEASSAIQATVPALVPELVAALHQAEAHRLPQRLGQAGLPAAQSLLAPRQSHLLAVLQVSFARRRFTGERTRQKHQGLATRQPAGEREEQWVSRLQIDPMR